MANRTLCIFDLDGTLYETARSFLPTMRRIYGEFGVPSPGDDKILAMVGETYSTFLEWLAPQGFSQDARELGRRISEIEFESIRTRGGLFPGVSETLAGLRDRGVRIALCTNGDRRYATHVLRTFEVLAFFDELKTNEDDCPTKSAMIGGLIDQFAPTRTYMVGDRIHDVEAGRANGCVVVGAAYGYGRPEELAGADRTIARFGDLLSVVDQFS